MKKMVFSALLIFASATCFAKGEPLVKIAFKRGPNLHQYTLTQEGKTPVYKMVFQENRKKPETETISKAQAEFIKNETTRIIWNSEYRKPKTPGCSEYANISSGTEKSTVCEENKKATGMAYGLLNSLSQIFQ